MLEPNETISTVYDKPFRLSYLIGLTEFALTTELQVQNLSTSTAYPPDVIEFQALFHTYLRAPAATVLVTPLQNVQYYDKTESSEEARSIAKTETRAGVDVRSFTDSVYENAPGKYEVTWPGGGISIQTSGLKDVVVWNPQAEGGKKMSDMEEGGWYVRYSPC